jgi:hypothetical protein
MTRKQFRRIYGIVRGHHNNTDRTRLLPEEVSIANIANTCRNEYHWNESMDWTSIAEIRTSLGPVFRYYLALRRGTMHDIKQPPIPLP